MEDLSLNFTDPLTPLVAYNWRTVSGTNVTDYSGNGNTGYLYGSPERIAYETNDYGVVGYSYSFTNGGGQYVNINSAINDIETLSDMTVMFWVSPDSIAENALCMLGITDSGDAASQFQLKAEGTAYGNGKMYFQIAENASQKINAYTTSAVLTAGAWHHVALRLGTQGNSLWINGVNTPITYADGSAASTNTISCIKNIDDMRIGGILRSSGVNNQMNGDMGTFKIFGRYLSNTEIAREYHWSKNGNDLEVYP